MSELHGNVSLVIISGILLTGVIFSVGCVQELPSLQNLQKKPGPDAAHTPGLLTHVSDVRQSQPYSCGAASLQAVLNYWGTDVREGVLMEQLNTSPDAGTPPDAIVRVARGYGLWADMRSNLTLSDLEQSVAEYVPVIIACQAWKDTGAANLSWENDWEDGHYMVVIGLDTDNVYFEDPAMLGTRGVIPRQEFLSRWHDYEGAPPFNHDSTVLYHAGIFIRGRVPATYPEFIHVD